MDGFEWDSGKAAANLVKHGIGFRDAAMALMGVAVGGLDATTERNPDHFSSACKTG